MISQRLLYKNKFALKRGWPVDPVAGEELESLAKEVMAQPPEVVQRLKKFLAE